MFDKNTILNVFLVICFLGFAIYIMFLAKRKSLFGKSRYVIRKTNNGKNLPTTISEPRYILYRTDGEEDLMTTVKISEGNDRNKLIREAPLLDPSSGYYYVVWDRTEHEEMVAERTSWYYEQQSNR